MQAHIPSSAPVAVVKDACFAALEDALTGACRVPPDREARHEIRCRASQILDSVHAGRLDLARLAHAARWLVAMRQDGWRALDTYSRATYGRGIRTILLPGTFASLQDDASFMARVAPLPEFDSLHFHGAAA